MSETSSTITPINPLAALRATHGTLVLLEQLAQLEDADAHRARAALELSPSAAHAQLAAALRTFVRQAHAAGAVASLAGSTGSRLADPDARAWAGRPGARGARR